jgi:hypothetical protein
MIRPVGPRSAESPERGSQELYHKCRQHAGFSMVKRPDRSCARSRRSDQILLDIRCRLVDMENRGGGDRGHDRGVEKLYILLWRREGTQRFQFIKSMARYLRLYTVRHFPAVPIKGEGPMAHAIRTRSKEPLPLGMAMLSNIALSLFMWNLALRIVGLLFAE